MKQWMKIVIASLALTLLMLPSVPPAEASSHWIRYQTPIVSHSSGGSAPTIWSHRYGTWVQPNPWNSNADSYYFRNTEHWVRLDQGNDVVLFLESWVSNYDYAFDATNPLYQGDTWSWKHDWPGVPGMYVHACAHQPCYAGTAFRSELSEPIAMWQYGHFEHSPYQPNWWHCSTANHMNNAPC